MSTARLSMTRERARWLLNVLALLAVTPRIVFFPLAVGQNGAPVLRIMRPAGTEPSSYVLLADDHEQSGRLLLS